jgi:ABC-2 type transport system permease protein
VTTALAGTVPAVATVPERAVLALSLRLLRRGALVLAVAGGLYVVVEVVSYLQAYPDTTSRLRLLALQENPSVRLLQGLAHDADTTGGFVAWDGGWFLETLVAVWALLVTGRLTRGDEEADRSVLVLTAPLRQRRVLELQLLVVAAAILLFAATCTLVLVAYDVPVGGATIFGLGVAGFACTVAAVTAVCAQLFDVRRRAVGTASAALALMWFVRMVGNSTDSRAWVRWLSPYGWMDDLQPYGGPRWVALALLLLTPVALAGLAASLRDRRDTGGATLPSRDSRRPHTRWLGSPVAFAWRSTRSTLLAWAVGMGTYALLMGSLLPAMTDYLVDDPGLRETLATFGIDVGDVTRGMVSFMGTLFGLLLSLYAAWRIGAVRTEEESGRADLMLVRPLTRRAWLGGQIALTSASVVGLTTSTGLCMWAGGRLTGSSLTAGDALASMLNTLPVALLYTSVALLLLGLRPRLAVSLSAGAAAVGYLLPVVGSALSLPAWLLDVSPFQHLARVPLRPYALTSGLVMLVLAAVLTGLGVAGFARRDLTGA